MLAALGLSGLPYDAIMTIFGGLVLVGVVCGWLTDLILGKMGFGVVGNAILTVSSALIGMAMFSMRNGPLRMHDASLSIGIAAVSAVCVLILVAAFKRAVLR